MLRTHARRAAARRYLRCALRAQRREEERIEREEKRKRRKREEREKGRKKREGREEEKERRRRGVVRSMMFDDSLWSEHSDCLMLVLSFILLSDSAHFSHHSSRICRVLTGERYSKYQYHSVI